MSRPVLPRQLVKLHADLPRKSMRRLTFLLLGFFKGLHQLGKVADRGGLFQHFVQVPLGLLDDLLAVFFQIWGLDVGCPLFHKGILQRFVKGAHNFIGRGPRAGEGAENALGGAGGAMR